MALRAASLFPFLHCNLFFLYFNFDFHLLAPDLTTHVRNFGCYALVNLLFFGLEVLACT